jgi:hypothetical protein
MSSARTLRTPTHMMTLYILTKRKPKKEIKKYQIRYFFISKLIFSPIFDNIINISYYYINTTTSLLYEYSIRKEIRRISYSAKW